MTTQTHEATARKNDACKLERLKSSVMPFFPWKVWSCRLK